MKVKLFHMDEVSGSIQTVAPEELARESNRPLLLLAPGFLAEALDDSSCDSTKLGDKPIRFAIRTSKEMLSCSGHQFSEYPEIACIAWPSVETCRTELKTLLTDPLFVGEAAYEFLQFLQTIQNRKIICLGFSYGGAFLQQIGASMYQQGYKSQNISVLSLGHPVGLTGHELFGLPGLYAVGNNDRVILKALSMIPAEAHSITPKLSHKTKWYNDDRGIYTFPVPIETILPLPSHSIEGISNITPKDIFDEYAHHPLGYSLASEGSRTFIDGEYHDAYLHASVLQRFLGGLITRDSGESIQELFFSCFESIVACKFPDLNTEITIHNLQQGIKL